MKVAFLYPEKNVHVKRFSDLFASSFSSYKEYLVTLATGIAEDQFHRHKLLISELVKYLELNGYIIISCPVTFDIETHFSCKMTFLKISFSIDFMHDILSNDQLRADIQQSIKKFSLIIVDNLATYNILISLGFDSQKLLNVPWAPLQRDSKETTYQNKIVDLASKKNIVLFKESLGSLLSRDVHQCVSRSTFEW